MHASVSILNDNLSDINLDIGFFNLCLDIIVYLQQQ